MLFVAKGIKISLRFSAKLSAGEGTWQQASRGDGERLKDPQSNGSGSPGAWLSARDGDGEFGAPLVPTEVKPGEKEESSGVGDTRHALGLS